MAKKNFAKEKETSEVTNEQIEVVDEKTSDESILSDIPPVTSQKEKQEKPHQSKSVEMFKIGDRVKLSKNIPAGYEKKEWWIDSLVGDKIRIKTRKRFHIYTTITVEPTDLELL